VVTGQGGTSRSRGPRRSSSAQQEERLRRRDPDAIEVFDGALRPRIDRVALGITRDPADAEDIVQDVFATITGKIETFRGRVALWTWLYRVITNAALNKRRGKCL
jgi:RNA polymerase sigma-70 factor (ECF subfamily)